jgi:hypothetical protein
MPPDLPRPPRGSRLPADRAFVIHLLDEADPAAGTLPGRIEHVTSGRSARFDDLPALLEFLRTVLADQQRRRSDSRRED